MDRLFLKEQDRLDHIVVMEHLERISQQNDLLYAMMQHMDTILYDCDESVITESMMLRVKDAVKRLKEYTHEENLSIEMDRAILSNSVPSLLGNSHLFFTKMQHDLSTFIALREEIQSIIHTLSNP